MTSPPINENTPLLRRYRFVFLLVGLALSSLGALADVPEYERFPAIGERVLLWISSERGRSDAETAAAQRLAARGTEVWMLDAISSYYLPPGSGSMNAVPIPDLVEWIQAAQATGKRVTAYAVARAAVPLLRATGAVGHDERRALCVLLMHPNLYAVADPLAEPAFRVLGNLSGLQVRVLQPRRSAATLWLPGLLDHLAQQGARVDSVILENLRESFWARETPTDVEIAEGQRLDEMLRDQLNAGGCP